MLSPTAHSSSRRSVQGDSRRSSHSSSSSSSHNNYASTRSDSHSGAPSHVPRNLRHRSPAHSRGSSSELPEQKEGRPQIGHSRCSPNAHVYHSVGPRNASNVDNRRDRASEKARPRDHDRGNHAHVHTFDNREQRRSATRVGATSNSQRRKPSHSYYDRHDSSSRRRVEAHSDRYSSSSSSSSSHGSSRVSPAVLVEHQTRHDERALASNSSRSLSIHGVEARTKRPRDNSSPQADNPAGNSQKHPKSSHFSHQIAKNALNSGVSQISLTSKRPRSRRSLQSAAKKSCSLAAAPNFTSPHHNTSGTSSSSSSKSVDTRPNARPESLLRAARDTNATRSNNSIPLPTVHFGLHHNDGSLARKRAFETLRGISGTSRYASSSMYGSGNPVVVTPGDNHARPSLVEREQPSHTAEGASSSRGVHRRPSNEVEGQSKSREDGARERRPAPNRCVLHERVGRC